MLCLSTQDKIHTCTSNMKCIVLSGISLGSLTISSALNGVCTSNETMPLWIDSDPFSDSWIHNENTYKCDVIPSEHGDNEECVDCINLYLFHFLFPRTARKEDMWICGTEIDLLCKTYLPTITNAWRNGSIAALIVILGISMHLTFLSYERTDLGEQYKQRAEDEYFYIKQHINSQISRCSVDADTLLLHEKINQ